MTPWEFPGGKWHRGKFRSAPWEFWGTAVHTEIRKLCKATSNAKESASDSKRNLENSDLPKSSKVRFWKKTSGKTRIDLGKVYIAHLGKISRNMLYFGTLPWENPTLGKGSRTSENSGKLSQASRLSQLSQSAVQGPAAYTCKIRRRWVAKLR